MQVSIWILIYEKQNSEGILNRMTDDNAMGNAAISLMFLHVQRTRVFQSRQLLWWVGVSNSPPFHGWTPSLDLIEGCLWLLILIFKIVFFVKMFLIGILNVFNTNIRKEAMRVRTDREVRKKTKWKKGGKGSRKEGRKKGRRGGGKEKVRL